MALKLRHRLSPLLVPAIKNVCVSMRLSDIRKILIKRVKSRAEAAQCLGQHLGVPVFLLFLLNVTKPEHEWEEFIRNAASPCGVELRKSVVVISSCGVFVDDHRCPESTSLRSRQHGVSGQTAGSVWANVVVCPAHGHAQACDRDQQCGGGMCCAVSLWIRSLRMCTPMGNLGEECHPLSHRVPFPGRRMHHTCPCLPSLACARTSPSKFRCLPDFRKEDVFF
ncbi:prokineticin-2 isoform X5 [Cygnus olor]|nr:prokineticin-2 isoform X5 [Cygnus olor]